MPVKAPILAVRTTGIRSGKPVDEPGDYLTSLRTSAKALLRQGREHWAIENAWPWVHDTQPPEDIHRVRQVNGVKILAKLRSLTINALGPDGIWCDRRGHRHPG